MTEPTEQPLPDEPETRRKPASSASYEHVASEGPVPQLQLELTELFNEAHEARRQGDDARIAQLREFVPGLLDEYEAHESQESGNPVWAVAVMRAGWHAALGEYEIALDHELRGLQEAEADDSEHAREPRAISASNVSDLLRRLGRAASAVEYGLVSCSISPANPVNLLVYALALAAAGQPHASSEVFSRLIALVEAEGGQSALAACCYYEDDLAQHQELPEAARLFEMVRSANGHADAGRPDA